VLFAYTHQAPNVTSFSRLDLLHALVTEGRLTIDTYHQNTTDKAEYRGSFYSDKPPGTVVLALPGFLLAAGLLSLADEDLESPLGWLVSSWLACALSLAVMAALGACAFFAWMCRWVPPRPAFSTTGALFLGAAPLPYTTMLFPHALVVAFICIALWATDFGCPVEDDRHSRDRLAGCCLGFAAASEFTSAPVLIGIVVALYCQKRARLLALLAAAAVPLALIPLYSILCFGTLLTLGYSHQAVFTEMHRGLYGIELPSADVALKLLFHPAKGLFVWSPWLLLSVIGLRRLSGTSRFAFWTVLAISIVQLVLISGNRWDWPAGYNLTPRYLAPTLPLLALPAALALQRFPRTGAAVVALSVAVIASATLLNGRPDFFADANYFTMYLPLMVAGRHAPNLGDVAGLPGLWSCLPFVLVLTGGSALLYWLAPAVLHEQPGPAPAGGGSHHSIDRRQPRSVGV